jgi:hypothetical protein
MNLFYVMSGQVIGPVRIGIAGASGTYTAQQGIAAEGASFPLPLVHHSQVKFVDLSLKTLSKTSIFKASLSAHQGSTGAAAFDMPNAQCPSSPMRSLRSPGVVLRDFGFAIPPKGPQSLLGLTVAVDEFSGQVGVISFGTSRPKRSRD